MRRSGILAFVLLIGFSFAGADPQDALVAKLPNKSGPSVPTPTGSSKMPGRFDTVATLLQQHVDRKQIAGAVALSFTGVNRSSPPPLGTLTQQRTDQWLRTPFSGSPL
jgi:hypothetical protein